MFELNQFTSLLVCIVLVESITEVVIKSVILFKFRVFFIERSTFMSGLLTCGYCFSFWASVFICSVASSIGELPHLITNNLCNFLVLILVVQRGSNIMHGAIDKYFDTRKDVRYNREKW